MLTNNGNISEISKTGEVNLVKTKTEKSSYAANQGTSRLPRPRFSSNSHKPSELPIKHSTPKGKVTRTASAPQSGISKGIARKPLRFAPQKLRTSENNFERQDLCETERSADVLSDVETDSVGTSDISSILSYDSTDHLDVLHSQLLTPVPSITAPNASTSKIVAKSRSCTSMENFLPSKYISGRTPTGHIFCKHNSQNSTNASSTRASSTTLRKSSSTHHTPQKKPTNASSTSASPIPLRKSSSTYHPRQTPDPKSKDLSPHLKYGIFNSPNVQEGGIRKSYSYVDGENRHREVPGPKRLNGNDDREDYKEHLNRIGGPRYRHSVDCSVSNKNAGNGGSRVKRSVSSASLCSSIWSNESEVVIVA